MEQLESQNKIISKDATSKQFLQLSVWQLLLYVLLSVLLLAVLNAKKAWDYFDKNIFNERSDLGVVMPRESWLSRTLNSLSHSIILQVAFWIAVGCIVYATLWFIRNIIINVMNDIAADSYIHPTTYKNYLFWRSVLIRKFISGISIVALIIYIGFFVRMVMNLAKLCYKLAPKLNTVNSLLELLGVIAFTAVLLYFLVFLVRVAVFSWRSIYRDL